MILLVFVLSALKPVQGEFKTTTITGKLSGKKITFDIYLPENYRKKGFGYPVIYSLHGRGGFYKNGGAFHPPIKKAIADAALRMVAPNTKNNNKEKLSAFCALICLLINIMFFSK